MTDLGKKAMIACAILTTLIFSAIQTESRAEPGDVNDNGFINYQDMAVVFDHILGRRILGEDQATIADANQDGKLDVADMMWIGENSYKPNEITVYLPGNVPMTFVEISSGTFQMGSPDDERSRDTDEGPVHAVSFAHNFYMGKTEVTQRQWLALMDGWPEQAPTSEYGLGDDYPAYFISWSDCQDFVSALNNHITQTSQGAATFRLPSEAEWEYSCRGATTTRFSFGDSLDADDYSSNGLAGDFPGMRSDYMWWNFNCSGNSNGVLGSRPVGLKLPNQFGLYDMCGNMWEWCQDWYHTGYHLSGRPDDGAAWETEQTTHPYRVLKGGGWLNDAHIMRSAYRGGNPPNGRYVTSGFRLVRTQ
jgi:formylglycine-generating enzyme required for sulfatase activity